MSLSLGAPFLFIDVAKVVQSILAYTDVVFCCHLLFISSRVCALKCMQIRLLSAVDGFFTLHFRYSIVSLASMARGRSNNDLSHMNENVHVHN